MEVESLVGSYVFDLQTEKYLGKIVYPIIDYEAQKVLGFVFKRAFYYPRKAFEFSAIKKVHGDFVIIEKDKARLLLRKKTLRKAFKKQRTVITLKLIEDERQVGKVFDFVADDETGSIKTLLAEKGLFSDIFRVPISKVKKFDVAAYILEKEAVPQEEKEKPGIFTRVLTSAAKKISSTAKRSKQFYGEGQKNMLLGQTSPCDIKSDTDEVLLKKGQEITEDSWQRLSDEGKLGELTAAVVGLGIGTRYRTYKEKKRKKALQKDNRDR